MWTITWEEVGIVPSDDRYNMRVDCSYSCLFGNWDFGRDFTGRFIKSIQNSTFLIFSHMSNYPESLRPDFYIAKGSHT